MSRAFWLVATQLRKNAAQSAFLAFAADARTVSGRDIAALLAAGLRRGHQEEAGVAGHLLVEVARLPVAVEDEQVLAADEAAHHRRVVLRVDVGAK
jgi:hypothetical protein